MEFNGRRIIRWQAATASAGAGLCYLWLNASVAGAVLYGGAASLANTLFWLWRMRQSERRPFLNAQQSLRSLYRSSLERFLVVSMLLVAGMGVLGLMPLAVLAGFVLGQLTLIISPLLMRGIE